MKAKDGTTVVTPEPNLMKALTTIRDFGRKHECDENCSCCGECYTKTGVEICNRLCEHAEEK